MSKPALYRKCDHWNDERGEWCEDGELQNAEGRVEDVYGWPVRCPECDGEGYVEFTSAQLAAVTAERDELRAEATMLHRALVDVMDWVRDFDFRDAAMKTLEQNATYEELRAMGFSGRSAWVDAKLEPLYAALAAADAALADGDAADGR